MGEPRGLVHFGSGVIPIARSEFMNCPPPLGLIRVQRFGKESLRQGRFFPAHARGQARSFALTPCVPLSRRRERGNALQGAPPCAPTPLSHAVGEGLGVRAKKRARPAHSELKRCTLISPLSRGDRVGVRGIRSLRIYGLWRCSWYNTNRKGRIYNCPPP